MIRNYSPPPQNLRVFTMIERLASLYHQCFTQVAGWFHGTDLLTQYVVIIVSGIIIFLLSMIMVLSKMSK